jgi:N-acyl-L-homoserine lactone synthetase
MPARVETRVAREHWEFAQIHRLNYQTFVEEIPQHAPDGSGMMVDRFDRENTYIVAVQEGRVVGMVAYRATRPFSLDQKLENLSSYLPHDRRFCEIRLLAIAKEARSGYLLREIFQSLWEHCVAEGMDGAVISGTTRQLRLYQRLGFVPFGPLIGHPGARFQPMAITRERAAVSMHRLSRRSREGTIRC